MNKFFIYTKNNTIEERVAHDNQIRTAFYSGYELHPGEYDSEYGCSIASRRPVVRELDISELRLCNTDRDALSAYVPQGTPIQSMNGVYCARMKYVALPGSLLYIILEEHKKTVVEMEAASKKIRDKNAELRNEIISLRNEIKSLNDNFDSYVQDNTSYVDTVKSRLKSLFKL